ncbi:lipopolysaccharide biosynthesis protein [Pseudoxanthomonas japonensis]|uniref:glycoside hydrolase family 99-like domain-containing protein n=1 Tax=Pseudoxanthomonas japonensis TaxID=69284 RepID=UPI00285A30D0|nr:glycoside hydrolase family 99-like domain-containing protein [Pseudoxanthomonas japonensis]MDR7067965.1 lipopolysaccharide biosynthesis protein [Pseudoxanthomonas japonensis]
MSNPLSRRLRTTLFYALRTAFRLTPMPQRARDRLRERFLDTKGHWVPEGPKGQAPTGELPRRPYVRSDERAIGYVPYEKGELPDPLPATLVAFYLPQFHTIPENDEWWGKGFTEWRNVTRALPQFEGHYQPKLPGDLGFYDLRNVEVMHEQARLAREYGISAFCFYFYWFGGKTLLETPLRNWLNDKTIDLKFCLCWANEKWTRTWDGRGEEILIDQQHSPEDDIAFIEYVAEYMRDSRYLRIEGRPALLVYRVDLLPSPSETAARWRRWCVEAGIGNPFLINVHSFGSTDPLAIGFDAATDFPPNNNDSSDVTAGQTLINREFQGRVLDWRHMAERFRARPSTGYRRFLAVNPSWDNQARRSGGGVSFLHASPEGYGDWLSDAITSSPPCENDDPPVVFINAWNEWAEGAALEPDTRLGHAWLQATRRALLDTSTCHVSDPRPCVVIHVWYVELLESILTRLRRSGIDWQIVITTAPERKEAVAHMVARLRVTAKMEVYPNRGRDVAPFLSSVSRLLLGGTELVLKLHTKKSPHLTDGDAWRDRLLDSLLDPVACAHALATLRQDVTVGMVAPKDSLLPLREHLGANADQTRDLALRIGIAAPDGATRFAAGTMFWARLSALAPLLSGELYGNEFAAEEGQIDGTMAHAVERLFVACVEAGGFSVDESIHPS